MANPKGADMMPPRRLRCFLGGSRFYPKGCSIKSLFKLMKGGPK
jgi:hypothetical protein